MKRTSALLVAMLCASLLAGPATSQQLAAADCFAIGQRIAAQRGGSARARRALRFSCRDRPPNENRVPRAAPRWPPVPTAGGAPPHAASGAPPHLRPPCRTTEPRAFPTWI